jgi:uncharacterized protein YjiS (DUF1127 family)
MDTSYFNNIQDPIARAEAMRAQAIAALLTDAFDGLRDLVKGATRKLVAHIEYRRTYELLSAMTDRELDDIGISRGDIPAVARGFDPRPAVKAQMAAKSALEQRIALAAAFEQGKTAANDATADRTAAAAA